MSYYVVIEIEIKDQDLYSEYVEKVYEIVTQYGGKYLVRGGRVTPFSNNWNPERMIIIEFQRKDQIRKCFQSSEYLEIASIREMSTLSKAIIVEGYRE